MTLSGRRNGLGVTLSGAHWLSRSYPWRCQMMADLFKGSGFKNNAANVFSRLILPDSDHFGQG